MAATRLGTSSKPETRDERVARRLAAEQAQTARLAARQGTSGTHTTSTTDLRSAQAQRDRPRETERDERQVLDLRPEKPDNSIQGQLDRTFGEDNRVAQVAFVASPGIIAAAGLGIMAALGSIGVGSAVSTAGSITRTGSITKGGFEVASATTQKAFTSKFVASTGVQKLFSAGKIFQGAAPNTATASLAGGYVARSLSAPSLMAVGGVIAAAAASMFFGQWGLAEAPEPLTIAMRDILKEAERTGDWELYEEAKAARDEVMDLNLFETAVKWSPLSPLIGNAKKSEGLAAGAVVMDKLAADLRLQQETGSTDDEKWEKIRQEKLASEQFIIDYYNDQRKLQVSWELEAKEDQRDADAAFWAEEKEKQTKLEEEDRQAMADFWTAYRKEAVKVAAENRPSNLNFGLL